MDKIEFKDFYKVPNIRFDISKLRLGLESDLQLTERGKFEWSWNTDKKYRLGLSYELSKMFLLTAIYDSDLKWGAGIRLKL